MAKQKIVIFSNTFLSLLEPLASQLRESGYEVIADPGWLKQGISNELIIDHIRDADAVIISGGHQMDRETLKKADKLKIISVAGSGYERVDLDYLNEKNIVLTNTPIPEMAAAVADLAFGFILAIAREIPRYDSLIKNGGKERGFGSLVYGKTLGILGTGSIGKEVIKRSKGFGMKIIANDIYEDIAFAEEYGVEYISLEQLLKQSDFISIHLRLNDSTQSIIGREELKLMKPESYIINTARKQLMDPEALYEYLVQKRIAGAALDFGGSDEIWNKIITLKNVIITPHLGNRCVETSHKINRCAVRNVVDVLEGREPEYTVNRNRNK